MGDAERQVKEKLKSYDVLLITKTTCPFSIRAKKITDGYMKQSASYYVWEINNEVNMSKIQDYIQNLTGARTVPRLFIKEKFIGGCDMVEDLERKQKLRAMLEPYL